MLLHINGEQREFPDGLTVAALVAQLGIKPDRVAVELNLEIVPRAQWEATHSRTGTNWKSFILSAAGAPAAVDLAQQELATRISGRHPAGSALLARPR